MSTVEKSEAEWRAVLNKEQVRRHSAREAHRHATLMPAQFRILRQKGTEAAGTGEYDKHAAAGVYTCTGCGTALYKSTTKFNVRALRYDARQRRLTGAYDDRAAAGGLRSSTVSTASPSQPVALRAYLGLALSYSGCRDPA